MKVQNRDIIEKITKKGRALFLAYDQGLEHGPTDFDDINVDPSYIISIAREGGYTGIIFQKGIAQKYKDKLKESGVPLILKLNGKTNLVKDEPISRQICSVKEAIELGAVGVGYTIYIGSKYENEMMAEFAKIEEEAHDIGLPVIAWIYPRGEGIFGKPQKELLAYAARVGLEIGADIIKLHSDGNKSNLRWAVKSAGRAKIVVAGGKKTDEENVLKYAREAIECGAIGLAIGRNIWQSKNPLQLSEKIRKIVFAK